MLEVPGSMPGFSSFLIFNIKQFALNVGQNGATNYCNFNTIKFRTLALCLYLLNIPFMWAYYQGGLPGIFLGNNSHITSSVFFMPDISAYNTVE